ncbi:hypothetical protein VIGAN_08302700 [Vigna angularis var. angularis]|uniref:Uncharacterized protein n=1 Tax=Vigna angularis var. angularis TaxID=157739 RepID=A0A0S3STI1_PHAAN|nr:hypothetical protein VIGAN_08302700 [Vigna angularis var. angularis]
MHLRCVYLYIDANLNSSGKGFLWVVKRPLEEEGVKQHQEAAKLGDQFDLALVLPDGFLEKTKDRGMVVKVWAPQVEVLSRESGGGGGCESLQEELSVGRGGGGVSMVAWPLYAKQHVNREVVV